MIVVFVRCSPMRIFAATMHEEQERPVGLDRMPEEQWARVVDLAGASDAAGHQLLLRLLELGFVPGERVRVLRSGPSPAAPLAVRVGHSTFALRRHEAAFILVSPDRP